MNIHTLSIFVLRICAMCFIIRNQAEYNHLYYLYIIRSHVLWIFQNLSNNRIIQFLCLIATIETYIVNTILVISLPQLAQSRKWILLSIIIHTVVYYFKKINLNQTDPFIELLYIIAHVCNIVAHFIICVNY